MAEFFWEQFVAANIFVVLNVAVNFLMRKKLNYNELYKREGRSDRYNYVVLYVLCILLYIGAGFILKYIWKILTVIVECYNI